MCDAEALAGQGFRDLLISSQLTDKRKIQRLARLAERGAWVCAHVYGGGGAARCMVDGGGLAAPLCGGDKYLAVAQCGQ